MRIFEEKINEIDQSHNIAFVTISNNFKNFYLPEMAERALKLFTMVEKKIIALKWLKMHSNCPPWSEKILKFTAPIKN